MDTSRQFEILVRRKIPLFSSVVYGVLIFFFAILFILYLIMLPTRHASGEMATAYYISVIPDALKTLSTYSAIGLVITVPLYYSARLHKPAILTFNDDHLVILGKGIDLNIPYRKIDKVYCNDLHNLFQQPKGILQFVIKQKRRNVTTFRLRHYDQGEDILSRLNLKQNIPVAFYEDDMVGDHNNE